MALLSTGKFKGKVTSVQITGYGANSGEIVVVIDDTISQQLQTYCVLSDTIPMMFTSYVSMLVDAFQKKTTVEGNYATVAGQTQLLAGLIFG